MTQNFQSVKLKLISWLDRNPWCIVSIPSSHVLGTGSLSRPSDTDLSHFFVYGLPQNISSYFLPSYCSHIPRSCIMYTVDMVSLHKLMFIIHSFKYEIIEAFRFYDVASQIASQNKTGVRTGKDPGFSQNSYIHMWRNMFFSFPMRVSVKL